MPAKGERQALPTRPIRRRAETTESLLPITCVCVCVCVCVPLPPLPWSLFLGQIMCVYVCVCVIVFVCVCVWAVPGNRGVHPAHVRVKRRVRRYLRCGATARQPRAEVGLAYRYLLYVYVCASAGTPTRQKAPPHSLLPRPALSAHVHVYDITPFAPPSPSLR